MVRRQSEVVSGKKVEKVKYGAKNIEMHNEWAGSDQ